MNLHYKINFLRNNILRDKNNLDNELKTEFNKLNIFFKKKNEDKNLVNSLNSSITEFYNNLYVEKVENLTDLEKNKPFIYYFSIFSSFEMIGLLYLYQNNQLEEYDKDNFKELILFYENEFSRILNVFVKELRNNDLIERETLFNSFKSFLDIPFNSKEDIELIEMNLKNKKKSIEEVILDDPCFLEIEEQERNLLEKEDEKEKIELLLKDLSYDYENKLLLKKE